MKLKEEILNRKENGEIVFHTHDGLVTAKIEEITKQPLDGLLYDLNRDEGVLLTFIDDKNTQWAVNSFALVQCLKHYVKLYNEANGEEKTTTV